VAAQAYLLTTQLKPGDPREHMHQATIKSLGLVEDKLRQHSSENKSTYYEDQGMKSRKYQSSQSQIRTHQTTKTTKHEQMMQGIL
jgi:hypothetical protein